MAKVFESARGGLVIRGEDDDELLANVPRHVAEAHPALVRSSRAPTSSRSPRRRDAR